MEQTSWKIFFGLAIFFGIAIMGVVIYGFTQNDIKGNNFYLFKNARGDIIVGSLAIVVGIVFLGLGVWYYLAHREHFFKRHQSLHEYHVKEKTKNLVDQESKYNLNNDYDDVLRQLKIKGINILLISLVYSFYFIFLGVSAFTNQKNTPSIYQAYERPCPAGTVSAENQKTANELTS